MASRLWRFLTTDISELISGETVTSTAEAAEAVFGLAEALQQEGPNVDALASYVVRFDTLLDVLNSPLAEIAEKSLPFVPIATGLLRFYLEKSKRPLSLENCVAIVGQSAYLESFKAFLEDEHLLQKIGQAPASDEIKIKTKELGSLEITTEDDARRTVSNFPNSKLAKHFGQVLKARLVQAGLEEFEAQILAERVAWRTPRYMNQVWAASAEAVRHLGQPTFEDWRQEQAKYQSIEDYLAKEIEPGPQETVFNEKELTHFDLYVPLEIKQLDNKGLPLKDEPIQVLETWVKEYLINCKDSRKVLFIQGEAGRGKSVFCRMFADWVRRDLYPAFTPILIRLRNLKALEYKLTDTLEISLESHGFVASNPSWLTDKNTRFLFLLDGFDELLLEGRKGGGLQEFLDQVESFQSDSHHQFLVTGRPLSLQNLERFIDQMSELLRVELQPMSNSLRELWYQKWEALFGHKETNAFKDFLMTCPEDINSALAREPLLLYMLGRMHREKRLNTNMFEGVGGAEAKVVIYDEAIRWVIEEQRQDENFRQVGLDADDLRRALTETALCVMQSGNETAKISFLEFRLQKDSNNPVYELLQAARGRVDISDKKLLNNLLTSFYIKPASGDREGSIEFAHKSFGEFLFSERLKDAMEDWSRPGESRRSKYLVETEIMNAEIYDLLGFGGLSQEVVDYLGVLLSRYSDFNPVQLFERLYDFYLRWWEGEFINGVHHTNHPQVKMQSLRECIPDRKDYLGVRQIDAITGLNVMILLLEISRLTISSDILEEGLIFYPCGNFGEYGFDENRFRRIMGFSECFMLDSFDRYIFSHLSLVNLAQTNLRSLDLSGANLILANLYEANLIDSELNEVMFHGAILVKAKLGGTRLMGAYLIEANLEGAELEFAQLLSANLQGSNLSKTYLEDTDLSYSNLKYVDLSGAYIGGANLFNAKLKGANFDDIEWNDETKWFNAISLHEAMNFPLELLSQPNFQSALEMSRGRQFAEEGGIFEAIKAYSDSEKLSPLAKISHEFWYILGRKGCLYGHATDVLFASEKAAKICPDHRKYQENLGLNKALVGDLEGALSTFQDILNQEYLPDGAKIRLEQWISKLEQDQNPFDSEVLKALLEEEDKDED